MVGVHVCAVYSSGPPLPGAASSPATTLPTAPQLIFAANDPSDRQRRQVTRPKYQYLHRGNIAPDVTEPAKQIHSSTALAATPGAASTPISWHEAPRCDDYHAICSPAIEL